MVLTLVLTIVVFTLLVAGSLSTATILIRRWARSRERWGSLILAVPLVVLALLATSGLMYFTRLNIERIALARHLGVDIWRYPEAKDFPASYFLAKMKRGSTPRDQVRETMQGATARYECDSGLRSADKYFYLSLDRNRATIMNIYYDRQGILSYVEVVGPFDGDNLPLGLCSTF